MVIHLLGGAVGGALSAAILGRVRAEERGWPLALLLGAAVGVYVGFGFQDGRPEHVFVQTAGALVFLTLAARRPNALAVLGAVWLAHGLWDGAHTLGAISTAVPRWYPPACLAWDAVLGGAALKWARDLKRLREETRS